MGDHSPPDAPPPAEPGWWGHLGDLEPIRRALWPVAVATVALLGGYGVLTGELAVLWLGLAAAVLGIGGAEVARSSAWSPHSVAELRQTANRTLTRVAHEAYGEGVQAALERTPGPVVPGVVHDGPATVEHAPPTRALGATRPAPPMNR